jgi:hypothetical protein
MDGIKTALLGLAKARPSALIKVYRVAIPEEAGGTFQSDPTDIARYFSCEVAFKGSEQSARDFLNSLGATDSHYFIIRTLKIQNERETPPQVSDAKFENSEAEEAAVSPDSPFGEAFFEQPEAVEEPVAGAPVAPDGEVVPPDGDAAPEEAADSEAPAPVADTSRILAQVLGNEEVIVFVRFDIAQFLPSKDLPKP